MLEIVSSTQHQLKGRVKWFDPVKGYGFVVPDEDFKAPEGMKGDILLHMSILKASGFSTVVDGAGIELVAHMGDRGAQASQVLSIDENAADSQSASMRPSEAALVVDNDSVLIPCRVKWFDKNKGFGFVNILGDPGDVFIHMEVLRRYGVADLAIGEAVLVRVADGPRGRMATEVRYWDFAYSR